MPGENSVVISPAGRGNSSERTQGLTILFSANSSLLRNGHSLPLETGRAFRMLPRTKCQRWKALRCCRVTLLSQIKVANFGLGKSLRLGPSVCRGGIWGRGRSGDVTMYCPPFKAAIFYRGTHLCSLETNCNSGRTPGLTWKLPTLKNPSRVPAL